MIYGRGAEIAFVFNDGDEVLWGGAEGWFSKLLYEINKNQFQLHVLNL